MATFFTDSGSFAKVDISGSGQDIFTVSGSDGALLDVSDLTAGANVFQISSASIDVFTIDQNKRVNVSGSLQITGSLVINGTVISADAHRSYYENIPVVQSTVAVTIGSNSNYALPFMIPYDVSISYIRFPVISSFGANSMQTTNNTTVNFRQTQTFWFNIYSAGNGASSKSLQYYTQASATMVYGITGQQGAATANQTISHALSYFAEGNTTNVFATSTNPGLTNLSFATALLSNFTGNRWMDIPFNTSLGSGMWWAAIQRSSATATTGPTTLTSLANNMSLHAAIQANANYNLAGATNAATNPLSPGLGYFNVSANGATTVSIALSAVNTTASQPRLPFQFIRFE